MVDTSLNKTYKAKEGQTTDFSPVPDGEYTLRVREVSKWEPKTQNVKVIQKDEEGKTITDEKGDKVTELVPNCTFYNCNAILEIVGGAYDGRRIFHNLTTHPNMDFAIPSFLWGLGLTDVAASDIQTICIGKTCLGDIHTESYEKKVQDKETGLDSKTTKYVNRVKKFKQLPTAPNNADNSDMGI